MHILLFCQKDGGAFVLSVRPDRCCRKPDPWALVSCRATEAVYAKPAARDPLGQMFSLLKTHCTRLMLVRLSLPMRPQSAKTKVCCRRPVSTGQTFQHSHHMDSDGQLILRTLQAKARRACDDRTEPSLPGSFSNDLRMVLGYARSPVRVGVGHTVRHQKCERKGREGEFPETPKNPTHMMRSILSSYSFADRVRISCPSFCSLCCLLLFTTPCHAETMGHTWP